MPSNGLLFVVSAPSGAGKSTLCRAMAERRPNLFYSISCTTRAPRPAETNGKDYHFLTEKDFKEKIARGEFLEWAKVHDNHYGTLRRPVEEHMAKGGDVIMDLDPQGALTVKKQMPEAISVYVVPPTWQSLEDRLRGRAQDDAATIAKRLANAREELSHLPQYDFMIVNQKLDDALDDMAAVIRAEHRRVSRLSAEIRELKF